MATRTRPLGQLDRSLAKAQKRVLCLLLKGGKEKGGKGGSPQTAPMAVDATFPTSSSVPCSMAPPPWTAPTPGPAEHGGGMTAPWNPPSIYAPGFGIHRPSRSWLARFGVALSAMEPFPKAWPENTFQRAKLVQKREENRVLLRFVRDASLAQRKRGGALLGENPRPSLAWKEPLIEEAFSGTSMAVCDMCMFGLRVPDGPHLRKRTRLQGTEEITKRCEKLCDKSHEHTPVVGGVKITFRVCRRIHHSLRQGGGLGSRTVPKEEKKTKRSDGRRRRNARGADDGRRRA